MEIETGENSAGILQFVQKKSPSDFIIINHGINYYCHFHIIAQSSPKIASLSGPNRPSTLILKTKYKLHFLQDVLDFFYGKPIIFNFTNYKEISILSNYFGVDSLIRISTQISTFFDFSNSLLKLDYRDITQKEIDFFATFFQVFSNHEIFKNFRFDLMKEIIKSDKLTIVNEDFLVHWILNDYKHVESQKKLLSFIVFEKVSFKGFKEIFSSIQNLEKIQEKIQREFVKDPRKRNLTIERNPRYYEKIEDLYSKILEFDLSTFFESNLTSRLNEDEKERENKDDLKDDEYEETHSFSPFSHQRERGQFSPKPFQSFSSTSQNSPSRLNISNIPPPSEIESSFGHVGQKKPISFLDQIQQTEEEEDKYEDNASVVGEDDEDGKNSSAESGIDGSDQSLVYGRLFGESENENENEEEEEEEEKVDHNRNSNRPLKHLFNHTEVNDRIYSFTSDSDSDIGPPNTEKQDIVKTIRMLMPKPNNK